MDNNLNKILHDIRNYRTLTKEQLDYIKNLKEDEKIDVIITYNIIMEHLNNIISTLLK